MNGLKEHRYPEVAKRGNLDVFKVAEHLISHAVETHADKIDIIGYYGSYAQGVATENSDLDIFYIPADGKNPPIGRTFLVEGVLFDFWGIKWDMMEDFATGQKRGWSFAPAIVYHAKVLHARSEEQAARFAALKQKVLTLQKPESRPQMIQRALDNFQTVLAHLGNLRLAIAADDFTDVRHAGWKIILSTCECLALANQTFFDRGGENILDQIPRLQSKPEDLEALIVIISTSDDPVLIINAADRLALSTRQILRRFQVSLPSQRTVRDVFDSAYPEIEDGIRKVITACERQQPVAASAAAWFIQVELSHMLNGLQNISDPSNFNLYSEFAKPYQQVGLPDLIQPNSRDLKNLKEKAKLLDKQLRHWLTEQSVSLCEFETLEEFKGLI